MLAAVLSICDGFAFDLRKVDVRFAAHTYSVCGGWLSLAGKRGQARQGPFACYGQGCMPLVENRELTPERWFQSWSGHLPFHKVPTRVVWLLSE